jgi:HlyD family secretion protein
MRRGRIIAWGLAALAAAGLVVWAFWPQPVPVDLAAARVAPMQVTVTAEGITRVRDPYLVTAPLTGIAARSPVDVGDTVTMDTTVVARIRPARPAFLDARARLQAEAAVTEAEAALSVAEANLARARGDLGHAEAELERNRALTERGVMARQMLEDAQVARDVAASAVAAAQSAVDLQKATVQRMQAQLVEPDSQPQRDDACCVDVLAPQSGTVLSVENLSERLVLAGTALLTIGDLADLEIEVDLLSSDAVRIAPGARAFVERWGGDEVLEARVRQIDPSGFTKVSALGIEEQRVRLRLDIVTPLNRRRGLGDQYRVFLRLVVWEADGVLQIPVSALFRSDGGWAVFRKVDGRAVLTPVEIGRQTTLDAQVLSGLAEGDRVVAFPGNEVDDGTRIALRADSTQ